jgi:hypothetical protein
MSKFIGCDSSSALDICIRKGRSPINNTRFYFERPKKKN